MKRITGYTQYKNDFFNKLHFPFQAGRKILDVGCGEGTDARVFINEYDLNWYGIDVYEDQNLRKNLPQFIQHHSNGAGFTLGTILKLPYEKSSFDYVFVHDVLHHVDETEQRRQIHRKGLRELRRVCKDRGTIIIVEGNRFNPLFYPHMVLMRGHQHFRQSYFKALIDEVFADDSVIFRFFEAHLYPKALLPLFKTYEWVMEHFVPKTFIAYNAAIIEKGDK